MPKSRQRKNHKQKLAARNQKIKQQKNAARKVQMQMMQMYREQMIIAQREQIIENIINGRPEVAKKVDIKDEEGNDTWTLQVDLDNMEEKEGTLYFKESGNPLMAGLAQLEEYPIYNLEYVNGLLDRIAYKQKMSSQFTGEAVTDADLGIDNEFELVEDEDFVSDAEVIEETTKDETMPDLGLEDSTKE